MKIMTTMFTIGALLVISAAGGIDTIGVSITTIVLQVLFGALFMYGGFLIGRKKKVL